MALRYPLLPIEFQGQGMFLQDTGIGPKPHGTALLLNPLLRVHKMNDRMGGFFIKLAGISTREPTDITCKLCHRHLHPQTDPQKGDAVLASIAYRPNFPLAVAQSGKVINVKKGQFLAPWDMRNVIEKIVSTGNEQVMVTERGVSFGYNYLVSDMRSLVIMRELGHPVVFDATHSLQLPGGLGKASGGERQFIDALARAGVAVGIDAIFMEVHEDPDRALSDGPNSLSLKKLEGLLRRLKEIDGIVKDGLKG